MHISDLSKGGSNSHMHIILRIVIYIEKNVILHLVISI